MSGNEKIVTTEEMKSLFGYLVQTVILEIDKEIEELKIPDINLDIDILL